MRKPMQRLTISELRTLWGLWKDGQGLESIAAKSGLSWQTVYTVVSRHGGIPPRDRIRSPATLSLLEREEISLGLVSRESIRAIARRLARAPSTVSREIRRHYGATQYRATVADDRAWRRAARPKVRRLVQSLELRRVVFEKIRADWSPQQIAAWLKMTYPGDAAMQLSHESIYRTLYVQARGALKRELTSHLRRQRLLRRSGGARVG